MGDILNQETIQAFRAEFLEKLAEHQKEAGLPDAIAKVLKPGAVGRGLSSLGRGTVNRIGSGLGGVGKFITDIPAATRETLQLASHPLKSIKKGWGSSTWMGKGKITKYLPVGQKSMTVGFAIPGLMEAYEATKQQPTPTGEGGTVEKILGEGGATGGFLAGMASKRAVIPSMALMMGGQYLGSRMGRVIDRLRGGAGLGTAVAAPSPTEASAQLEDIQRYYQ